MNLELDDAERARLVETLRQIVEYDPFPMSPRVRTLRAILGKLEPPKRLGEP